MKNLSKIILTGMIATTLTGCKAQKISPLEEGDFAKAEWKKVPYTGKEIRTEYNKAMIVHLDTNWATYCRQVARKNGADCYKDSTGSQMVSELRADSIYVPTLNQK